MAPIGRLTLTDRSFIQENILPYLTVLPSGNYYVPVNPHVQMNRSDNAFFRKKSFRIGICVFLSVAALTQFMAYQQYQLKKEEELRKVHHELTAFQNRLKKVLSYSLAATHTLAFIVEKYGVPTDFNGVAKDILTSHQYIDAIQLTQQGVITHIYPLKGNEAALGFDILRDSTSSKEALKTIEKCGLFFAGPLKLKQGGIGIVGRVPIYLQGKFFGFSAVVIRLSTLLEAMGIDSIQNNFNYQLSKINPVTGNEEFFLPDSSLQLSRTAAASIGVADGEWNLYVSMQASSVYNSAFAFSLLGFILSFMSALVFYQWAAQPEKLKKLVAERTTQLRESEQAMAREKYLSDSIINSLPGIFYLYNSDRKFIRWNKNFEIISGYSYEEVCVMHPLDFYDEPEKKMMQVKIESVFTNGYDDVETFLFTKDNTKIPYYFNGCRATFNGESYLIGMGIDIVKRKQVEQDALSLIDDLQRKNKDLQQFSYIVSHNLRAPIAKIIGLVNVMGDDPEQNKKYHQLIANEAASLDEIVMDINTIVSTRKTNSEKYEPVSFAKIVEQVTQVLETEIRTSEAMITTDFSSIGNIVTLKSYVYSIVYNLITNAIKYRQRSVPLHIHISTRQVDQFVCLDVTDNGRGIDLKKHEAKLFGLYKRFHLDDSIPGRGVGLSLVKAHAESLGGKVVVKSEVNVGSSFQLFLPLQYDTTNTK